MTLAAHEAVDPPSRILVTGFISIDLGINASEVLVSSLLRELPNALLSAQQCLHFRLIEADTHDLRNKLEALLQEVRPTDCVFIGQAPGRNKITLERIATNLRFTGPPLSPGDAPQSAVIQADGPDACMATLLHTEPWVEKLKASGIPAALSDHAGNNLCNQILYQALQYAQQNAGRPRCGFVHIPALPQQVIERWPDYPCMSLEMLRTAITVILLELVGGVA